MRNGLSTNLGGIDRLIRGVLGLAGVAAWVFGWLSGTWAVVLGIVGVVLVLTAVFGFCPIYRALGMTTAPRPHAV